MGPTKHTKDANKKSLSPNFRVFSCVSWGKSLLPNRSPWRLVIASCVFSAKGAISIPAWGDAPGIRLSDKQALKARLKPADCTDDTDVHVKMGPTKHTKDE
jgi:hypothetical protein